MFLDFVKSEYLTSNYVFQSRRGTWDERDTHTSVGRGHCNERRAQLETRNKIQVSGQSASKISHGVSGERVVGIGGALLGVRQEPRRDAVSFHTNKSSFEIEYFNPVLEEVTSSMLQYVTGPRCRNT